MVRDRLSGGDRLADHAVDEETDAKRTLARLEKLSPSQAEFSELLSKYIPAAREHIDYEEAVVWPALQEVLTAAEASRSPGHLPVASAVGLGFRRSG